MSVLISGMSGFIGSHLAPALVASGAGPIYGTRRYRPDRLPDPPGLHWLQGDLQNAAWVTDRVCQIQPRQCFHLAAQSNERHSWTDPWHTYAANLQIQLNVLEALRQHSDQCRILIASSSAVYGFMQGDRINETHPLQPVSPYGVSKAAQDLMGRQYAQTGPLPIVISRTFNIIGPGQSSQYALSSFACQIAMAEAGRQEPVLAVGNLDVTRDFLDVRDLIRAWQLLITEGQSGEAYNVARGQTHRLRDLVQLLLRQARVSMTVRETPGRIRAGDPNALCANIQKLQGQLDWAPTIPLEQTLQDMLEYWRKHLAA